VRRPYADLENFDRGEMQNRLMMDATFATQFPTTFLQSMFIGLTRIICGLLIIFLVEYTVSVLFLYL
jgi:hypothetical protein